ncbi:MAG: dihydroorotase [Clostridia bacterium]|nr:dihydroorotase [Clostridia bacterium]
MSLIIKNAMIVNADSVTDGDIMIRDGVVVQVGGTADISAADQVMEAEGLCAFPGLVDMHVHLRDPGQTHKEDIHSGCAAAAAGGVTSLVCMPNTSPAVDSPEIVRYIIEKAKETGIHVYPAAAITYGLSGEGCCDYEALRKAGAAAISDDGRPVENDGMLLCALQEGHRLGLPVLCHCEDLSQAAGGKVHEGRASGLLGVKGMSSSSEYGDIERTLALAESVNAPVHICHVSTKESIEVIRLAKARGVKVTCETAPHYFIYTYEKVLGRDADYRMNPPLREESDRLAVIEGLLDGTIDAIATDHAPHSPEEKSDFVKAPNGVIGMETSLAAALTYLRDKFTLCDIVKLMSYNPARIMGIPGGAIKAGAPADITLIDLNENWTVDTANLHGRSKNAVFKGETLTGRVKATYCGGRKVF